MPFNYQSPYAIQASDPIAPASGQEILYPYDNASSSGKQWRVRDDSEVNVVMLKHNYAATTAPGTGDDVGDGYSIGSIWVDTSNGNAYICEDNATGAAVWLQINGGGSSDGRAVTYIVAASDAVSSTGADYVCDGTADDVQIQAAIDAVAVAGSGVIYLTEGTFTFANPVAIDTSNITIMGAGRGITTLSGLTSTDGYIELAPGTGNTIRDIVLSDFTIDGGASGTTVSPGQIFQDDDGVIERLLIERIRITGTSSTENGITFENASGTNKWITIRDVIIELSAASIYGISFRKTAQHVWVENCHVALSSASSYNAIAIYADVEDFHVNNNYATSRHSPITCSPANNGEIVGNIVDGQNVTSEGGIEIEWKASHNGSDTSHDITVSNNLVRGGYWGILVIERDAGASEPADIIIANNIVEGTNNNGIHIANAIRIQILNNAIRNAGGVGISLLETTNALVDGNIIASATGVSIRSEGAVSDSAVVISGNIIDSGGSTGITLESGSGNYVIKDNYIDGMGAFGLSIKTNNGLIADNFIGTAASGAVSDTGTGNFFARNSNNPQDAVHLDGASEISTLTEKASPVSGDLIIIEDSADSNAKKKVQIGNLPSGGGGSSPLTTKGDLYTYTTTDARLPVGTNGQILSANSAETTGLEWIDNSGGGGASATRTTETLLYKKTLASADTLDTNDAPDTGSTDLSGYDHLKIIIRARSDAAGNTIGTRLYMNADTTDANYRTDEDGTTADRPSMSVMVGNGSTAGWFTLYEIFIPNYTSATYQKIIRWLKSQRDATLDQHTYEGSFTWESTSAITRVRFQTSNNPTDELLAGSSIEVYGIKQESIGVTTFLETSSADVSNPPTDAELDAEFGTPASVGNGFGALLDDNGADTNVYAVFSNGTSWFYSTLTKAT